MEGAAIPGTRVERLAAELFDGLSADGMDAEVVEWMAGTRRFRDFVERHRDKIRKKLRGAADTEARRDVRAELRVAQVLLTDRRIELRYEADGPAKGGPDFGVIFRGHPAFNLEVTRLRSDARSAVAHHVLAKLRQLPASTANALLLAMNAQPPEGSRLDTELHALRARADAKDERFFTTRGFDGSRDFYRRYLRLGAVLLWSEGAVGDARATAWLNRSARIGLPAPALSACVSCLRAG
jgi:hypothetical protein